MGFRDKQKTTNFTLRLPEEYRKRLQMQADKRGISVNAHVLRILEIHLMQSGFGPPSMTSINTGRLFEIRTELVLDNVEETTWAFFVNEPKYEKERAYYMIGVGRTVLRDWNVKDKVTVAKDVGMSLLNLYNRQGLEVDRLKWTQFAGPDNDGRRILQASEVPESLEEFLAMLMNDTWKDTYVEETEKSQDIRRGRQESVLYR
jgi:hypothetical protein